MLTTIRRAFARFLRAFAALIDAPAVTIKWDLGAEGDPIFVRAKEDIAKALGDGIRLRSNTEGEGSMYVGAPAQIERPGTKFTIAPGTTVTFPDGGEFHGTITWPYNPIGGASNSSA